VVSFIISRQQFKTNYVVVRVKYVGGEEENLFQVLLEYGKESIFVE